MGDRISIQFVNGADTSVVFFSRWDGLDLKQAVERYFNELSLRVKDHKISYPITRLEPNTVIVDFIRWYVKESIDSNYYLGRTQKDGDNSDNGHHIFNLPKGRWEVEE